MSSMSSEHSEGPLDRYQLALDHLQEAHEFELDVLRQEVRRLQQLLDKNENASLVAKVGINDSTSSAPVLSSEGSGSKLSFRRPKWGRKSHDLSGRPRSEIRANLLKAEIERNERGGCVQRLVESSFFEVFFIALIVFNTAVMAVEVQYSGLDLGDVHDLAPQPHRPAKSSWPHAEGVFNSVGWICGVLFVFELVMRVVAFRCRFLKSVWNLFDFTVVALWVMGACGFDIGFDPLFARLLRLARLARLMRLLRKLESVDSLVLMVTAIRSSSSVLLWSGTLIFMTLTFIALVLYAVLYEFFFKNEDYPFEDRKEVYIYFGSFTRSMFSLFEITMANWPPVSRILAERVSEWFMFFAIALKLSVGFAVIGVINGVFMQETFKVAASDDTIMVRQSKRASRNHVTQMLRLFEMTQTDTEGSFDLRELRKFMDNPENYAWLTAIGIDPTNLDQLFIHLDEDQDGFITIDELIVGIARLKGPAKSIDSLSILKELRELRQQISMRTWAVREDAPRMGVPGLGCKGELALEDDPVALSEALCQI